MQIVIDIAIFLVSAIIFTFVGMAIRKKVAESKLGSAEEEARKIINLAQKEAENKKKEEIFKAKEEIMNSRKDLDNEIRERRSEVQQQERRLLQKEENLENKMEHIERKEQEIENKKQELENKKQEISKTLDKQMQELQRISGLSKEEAKNQLLADMDKQLTLEKANLIKNAENKVKEESIKMSFDFLTKELNIPVEKLSVTCFAGDEDCPRDEETASIWKKVGIPENHVYYFGKDNNWWIAGEEGPCGPDTEMFYDTGKTACSENCNPSCDCGKYVEIWNNVFMQYYKNKDGSYSKLEQKNVDTGLGLERMAMLLQGKETPFDIEIFKPVMDKLEELQKNDYINSRRIVAEHLRTSMMIISDGGRPSNVDRGYVLRRLIRRMTRHMNKLGIDLNEIPNLIDLYIDTLQEMYTELDKNRKTIKNVIVE